MLWLKFPEESTSARVDGAGVRENGGCDLIVPLFGRSSSVAHAVSVLSTFSTQNSLVT